MSVPWNEARATAFAAASALPAELLPLSQAAGRTLARDVAALQQIPHYASSAMDGWAVAGPGPWRLVAAPSLGIDEALPIVTGALVPSGTEAVLRSESGVVDGGTLRLGEHARPGEPLPSQHIRPAGEEARSGEVLIAAATLLNPAHIALAASCGHDELLLGAIPRVALVLTGDEVVESGLPAPGRVRDSFGPQLPSTLGMLGARVVSSTRVPDDREATVHALATADADLVITTGGTGGSPADHLRPALEQLGATVLVERLAIRPGGPSLLARLPDGKLIVGLAGNPLAATVGLLTLAAPLLSALAGGSMPQLYQIVAGVDVPGRAGSTLLVPYRLVDGRAVPAEWLGSGMMRGLADAHGIMLVAEGGLRAGDGTQALPLPWVLLGAT